MPKFNLDINGVDVDAAEERQVWSGELPVNGTYEGILKILSIGSISDKAKIAANRGKPKLQIGIELVNTNEGKYDGFIAWGSINLIESSLPFLNQFLRSLTDGSETQFTEVKKAFYETKPIVDETRKHVLKIGRWKTDSPNGTMPVKVTLKQQPGFYNSETKQTSAPRVQVESYLIGNNSGPVSSSSGPLTDAPVEEENVDVDIDENDIDTEPAEEADYEGDPTDSDEMFEESNA